MSQYKCGFQLCEDDAVEFFAHPRDATIMCSCEEHKLVYTKDLVKLQAEEVEVYLVMAG